MKYLLILLIPMISLAQYPEQKSNYNIPESFIVEGNILKWIYVFQGNPDDINHPKINNGIGENLQINSCKGTSFFISERFKLNYSVDKKENRYRITVYNIVFSNSINLNLDYVKTDISENNIEFYLLKKDGTIKSNSTSIKNLNCLHDYFVSVFKPNAPNNDDW